MKKTLNTIVPKRFYNEPNPVARLYYNNQLSTFSCKFMQMSFCTYFTRRPNSAISKKNPYTISFTLAEFSEVLNIPRGGSSYDATNKTVEELPKAKFQFSDDSIYKMSQFNIIDSIVKQGKNIIVYFNPEFIRVANKAKDKYAHIEMPIIAACNSVYEIRIYEILKSYYNTKGRYHNSKDVWRTEFFEFNELKNDYCGFPTQYKQQAAAIRKFKSIIDNLNKHFKDEEYPYTIDMELTTTEGIRFIRFVGTEFESKEEVKEDRNKNFETEIFKNSVDPLNLIETKHQIIYDRIELGLFKTYFTDELWEHFTELYCISNPLQVQGLSKKEAKDMEYLDMCVKGYIEGNFPSEIPKEPLKAYVPTRDDINDIRNISKSIESLSNEEKEKFSKYYQIIVDAVMEQKRRSH